MKSSPHVSHTENTSNTGGPTSANFVLVGGSGFVGSAITQVFRDAGVGVTIVDRRPPPGRLARAGVTWIECDLLKDDVVLPDGHVVILAGNGHPRPRWPWTLALDIGVATARLLPALYGRKVTLISSIEAYGAASQPLCEDTEPDLPWSLAQIREWCEDARTAALSPCPPWQVAALCRRLSEADPSGRWVYGMAKLAQELMVRDAVPEADWTVLRLANTFGAGQERVVSRLVRRALANRPLVVTPHAQRSFLPVEEVAGVLLKDPGPGIYNVGSPAISIGELATMIVEMCASSSPQVSVEPSHTDSCGIVDTSRLREAGIRLRPLEESLAVFVNNMKGTTLPFFDPPLPVVIPPRPARPDELADRHQEALWRGQLKNGNRWSTELGERLRCHLELEEDDELLLTTSGTDALRIAIAATAGSALPGQVAVLPSFTFPATAEALLQLGYTLRFVDVDACSWTLKAGALQAALADGQVRLVVCVDTFGNPCNYRALQAVCSDAGVPLIADSAASLGSLYRGSPVGTQAAAHAFSMSFAKVLSAGGAGGAVVLRSGAERENCALWLRSALMDELHAAAALDQLLILDELVERRARIAAIYASAVEQIEGLTMQHVEQLDRHSYVHWVTRVPSRNALQSSLAHLGIETRDYFRALHLQQSMSSTSVRLPVTEELDAEVMALPMSSEMTEEDAEAVVAALELAVSRL
ncbi:MAG: aminotransferase class I/II-fold pyridoxal phosphate-dependent enzyme [Chloroflexota bacterium]